MRLQFLLSTSGIKSEKVDAALSSILSTSSEKPYVIDAALSGLAGREIEFLKFVLADPGWDKETPGRKSVLTGLSSSAFRSGKGPVAAQLFETAAMQKEDNHWRQVAILAGVSLVTKGQGKPSKVTLAAVPQALLDLTRDKDPVTANLANQAEAYVRWPGMLKEDKAQTPLSPEQKESFSRGKVLFGTISPVPST